MVGCTLFLFSVLKMERVGRIPFQLLRFSDLLSRAAEKVKCLASDALKKRGVFSRNFSEIFAICCHLPLFSVIFAVFAEIPAFSEKGV